MFLTEIIIINKINIKNANVASFTVYLIYLILYLILKYFGILKRTHPIILSSFIEIGGVQF